MLDRLVGMQVFIAVVEQGSFVGASEKLAMSSQMVARHITALENHLGTRLIQRTTRRQHLTEFGHTYYQRTKQILNEIETTETLAQQLHVNPRGLIKVNAPVTFGRFSLAPFAQFFLDKYPDIQLDLSLSDQLVDYAKEEVEAIFRIGPLDQRLPLIAVPLKKYQLIACATPRYIARHGMPDEPHALSQHQCIGFSPWPMDLRNHWYFYQQKKEYIVSVSSRLTVNDWGAMYQAALADYGIILAYDKAVEKELASGQLVQVLADYSGPARELHLLYARDKLMTPKLQCFIDEAKNYFNY